MALGRQVGIEQQLPDELLLIIRSFIHYIGLDFSVFDHKGLCLLSYTHTVVGGSVADETAFPSAYTRPYDPSASVPFAVYTNKIGFSEMVVPLERVKQQPLFLVAGQFLTEISDPDSSRLAVEAMHIPLTEYQATVSSLPAFDARQVQAIGTHLMEVLAVFVPKEVPAKANPTDKREEGSHDAGSLALDTLMPGEVFQALPDATWIVETRDGAAFTLQAVNKAYENITGLSGDEIAGKSFDDLESVVPRPSLEQLRQYYHQAWITLAPVSFEQVNRVPSGTYTVAIALTPFALSDGRVLILGRAHDVSQRNLLTRELSESEQTYRELFDNSPDAILLADTETGIILDANRKACALTGYPPDKLMGMHQSELHPAEYPDTFHAHLTSATNANELVPLRNSLLTATGERVPVEITAGFIQYRGKKVLCGVFRDIRNQLLHEQQLIESETKFRELAENAPAIVFRYRLVPEPRFEYVSPACTAITGYTPDDHYADPMLGLKLVHPDDRPLLEEFMQNPGRQSLVLRWIARDGSVKWTSQRLNVIADDTGNPVAIEGMAIDETPQREALDALLKSENRFREYIQKAPDGITIVNREGRYLEANPAACQLLGYHHDQLLEMAINQLVTPEDLPSAREHFQQVVSTGKSDGIFTFMRPDGSRFKASVAAAKLADDRFIGFVKDVSEQMRVVEALRRSEADYRRLFDQAHDVILIFRPHDELILAANQQACKLYGYSQEELIGRSLVEFSVNPALGKEWIDQTLQSGSIRGFETRHRNRYGKEIVFEASASFVDYQGENAILSINRDITDRRHAEELLRESEAQYRQLTENLTDVVWTLGLDGRYLYISPASFPLFGYAPLELQNLTLEDILTPSSFIKTLAYLQKAREEIQAGNRQSSPISFEVEQYHKKGHTLWVDVKVTRVFDSSGQFLYFLGMSRDVTWKHQTEEQLRESELRLRYALKVTSDVVWDWDVAAKRLVWNEAGEHIFGWSDIVREPQHEDWWGDRVHPDDFQRADDGCMAVVNNPSLNLWSDEYRFRKANGEYAIVIDRGHVIRDKEGRPLRMIGAMLDITEQRAAEEAARRNAECDTLLLKLYSSSNDLTENELFQQSLAIAMQVTRSEAGFCHRITPDQQSVVPTAWDPSTKERCSEAYPESYSLGCTGFWARCLDTGKPYICNHFGPETATKPIPEGHIPISRFMSIPVMIGEKISLILGVGNKPDDYNQTDLDLIQNVANELTRILDKRAIYASLTESNQLNETLLRTIPFAIDIVDTEGNVLFMNDNMRSFFPEGIEGKKCWELYRDDKTQCFDCPLLRPGGVKIGESWVYETSKVMGGRIFEINHTGMVFKGKPAMLEIFRDITSRKQTEADLVAARNKAEEVSLLRSRLLANLSHEIRTPLNGIMGFAEYLVAEVSDPVQLDMVESIYHSGERLLDTLTGILDLSAFESTFDAISLKEASLNDIVRSKYHFYESAARSKGLFFDLTVSDDDIIIQTKEELVGKIVGHLLSNGIKFTKTGSVNITVGSAEIEGKVMAFVKVVDTGIGIASEHLGLIFEEFRQVSEGVNRAYEGTGLGLHISQRFAQLLGGRITVDSSPGMGSAFTLWLPLAHTSTRLSEPNSPLQPTEGIQLTDRKRSQEQLPKVLLVEDDEPSAVLAELILKKTANIQRVSTGEEAIALLWKEQFHAVLMDINLGSGISGIVAVERIRAIPGCKNLPIAAVTANALDGHREEYLSRGCTHYLTKPYRRDDLLALVSSMT